MSNLTKDNEAITTDSSEDEDNSPEPKWTLYSQRDDWRDVTPVPQDDGPYPIVAISYTATFVDAFDYFRAIFKSGEKSERALELTKSCIFLNPANYTVWEYRRDILQELKKDLNDELQYTEEILVKNTKNYQVWHHRKLIVERLGGSAKELPLTDMILQYDAKNYHSWQYRQWYMRTYNVFDNELEYINTLLEKDVRNNSAWNQRYFVIENTTKFEPEVIDREVTFTLEKIMQVKKNESAWSYLKGILLHDKKGGLGCNQKVLTQCEDLFKSHNRSNHLLVCIIDIIVDRFEKCQPMDDFYNPEKAFEVCGLLQDYDTMRHNYWKYMSSCLTKLFGTVQS